MLVYDPALNPLRDVLAILYQDAKAATMVAQTAGLDTTQIDMSGSPQERWFAILRYAYQNELVEKIIEIVTAKFPKNNDLKEAIAFYRSAPPPQLPPTTTEQDLYSLENKIKLRDILAKQFSIEELKDLTYTMGIEYENIEGSILSAKARELVKYLTRRRQLEDLVSVGSQLRPDIVDWP